MEPMTGKERIMTALTNGKPDRVPATPDISTMIPCKLTGKPFWEVEYNQNPSNESAYIHAAKFFGIDGWLYSGKVEFRHRSEVEYKRTIIKKSGDRWEASTVISTPDGDLTSITVVPQGQPGYVYRKTRKKLQGGLQENQAPVFRCDFL